MKKYSWAALIGGAMIAVIPASASQTTFNFAQFQADSENNSTGDSLSMTVGGVTVTETAWSLGNGYTNSSTFVKATVNNYDSGNYLTGTGDKTLGLGVCSANDSDCGSPHHQVDNAVGDEFILFTFSGGTVSLGQNSALTVANYTPDSSANSTAVDLDYYTAQTAITTLAAEGTGNLETGNAGSHNQVVYSNLVGGNITYLLVGAATGETFDAFKINSLTVNVSNTVSPTPEPATFGLIGLALAGLGVYGRKRKSGRS